VGGGAWPRHIHHLVWGILILLLVGYGWLMDLGRSHSPLSIFFSRLMSVGYGVGAALTLDEFALWLDLEPDAYWSSAGRSQASTPSSSSAACWPWAPGARRSSRPAAMLWDKRATLARSWAGA
jgi:hypothetical protein